MLKGVENELRRISWLVYDFGSIGCRELHRPNAEDWADTVHDLRRLRRDLHTSADQNAKLTADLDTLKQTVRDASTFAKSLIIGVHCLHMGATQQTKARSHQHMMQALDPFGSCFSAVIP